MISFGEVVKSNSGSFHPRDCSTASLMILLSLSSFFGFHSFRIDLSEGRNIIWSRPHSVSFWTINSTLSRLFGIAIIILLCSCGKLWICWETMVPSNMFLSRTSMRISYLVLLFSCFGLWTRTISPRFVLRTFLSCDKSSASETMMLEFFFVYSVMKSCIKKYWNDKMMMQYFLIF